MSENLPHKHAECIKAWANGEQIEYKRLDGESWHLAPISPAWNIDCEYRIKPEPIMARMFVTKNSNIGGREVYVQQSNWTIQPELLDEFDRWLTDWVEIEN